jgi:hypothetical protein
MVDIRGSGGMMMDHDDSQTRDRGVEELNAALPRKVRLSDGGRNSFWGAVSLVVVEAILLAVGCQIDAKHMRQRGALRSEGRDAPGDVTAKGQSRSGVWVDYTFEVDGLAYQGYAVLPDDRRINPKVGGQIPVRYLPSDPSISHPSDWEWSAGWDIVPLIFMQLFPVLGAVMLVAFYRQRELARKGWVVEGKVTGCAPNGTKFRVYYEFHADTGALIEGSNEYADEYKYGSAIRIIYLRAKPARNDCYPVASYQTVE